MPWLWSCGLYYILRRSDISNFPLFWLLESYYIIMTDIFWHDFHWMHVLLLIWHPYMPFDCDCLSPHSIWETCHAWTIVSTLYIIMIMHCNTIESIISANWVCNNDLDSTVSWSETWLITQFMCATRHVKNFFELLNTPKHESYGSLEEDEKVCLKTSLQSGPSPPVKPLFSNLAVFEKQNPKSFKYPI